MNRLIFAGLASALMLAGCGGGDAGKGESKTSAIKAPEGANWAETFAVSADNGMVKGNPNAPVKLLEYGALSCPACAQFSVKSSEKLSEYVAKGTVSVEFRPFMIHPQDLPASLLAMCNGPGSFFGIADQMYANQQEWMAKSANITETDQKSWGSMQPNQIAAAMAEKLELVQFVQQRGVPADKAKACLADPAGITKLEGIVKKAQEQQVTGTPTFFINGVKAEGVAGWDELEVKLKQAGA